MGRLPDWEPRLSVYLAAARKRPHAYGRHDCMTYCAGAVEALTGRDLVRAHRGKYKSAASAARYMKSLGFHSFEELIDSLLEAKPVMRAGRGDIVLDAEGMPGVCIGGEALFVGQDGDREGLVRVPRRDWVRAWHV